MKTLANTQNLNSDQVQELISGESYIIIGRETGWGTGDVKGWADDACEIFEEEVNAWYEEYTDALSHRFTLEELINEVRPEGSDATDEGGSSIYILSNEDLYNIKNVIRTRLKEFYVEEADSFGVEHYKEAIQSKIDEGENEEEAVIEAMNEELDTYAAKAWWFGIEIPNNGNDGFAVQAVQDFIEAMEELGLSYLGNPGHEGYGAGQENRGWRLF